MPPPPKKKLTELLRLWRRLLVVSSDMWVGGLLAKNPLRLDVVSEDVAVLV